MVCICISHREGSYLRTDIFFLSENEVSDTTQVSDTFEGSELEPDTLFSNLHKLQKEISKLILSDTKFKLVVDRVRHKQAAKSKRGLIFILLNSNIIYQ